MTITLFDPRTGKPVTITVPDRRRCSRSSARQSEQLRAWERCATDRLPFYLDHRQARAAYDRAAASSPEETGPNQKKHGFFPGRLAAARGDHGEMRGAAVHTLCRPSYDPRRLCRRY